MCFKFDVESLLLQHYFRKHKRLFFLNWSLILLFLFCFCENIRMVKTFKIRAENSNEKWKCLSFFDLSRKASFCLFWSIYRCWVKDEVPVQSNWYSQSTVKMHFKGFWTHHLIYTAPFEILKQCCFFFPLKKEYYSKTVLGNAFAEVDVAKK